MEYDRLCMPHLPTAVLCAEPSAAMYCAAEHMRIVCIDIWMPCGRLDAPFGTPEKPVEVPSMFDHRVVGVPDPDDDSIVWWGIVEEGQPPKQIIEEGEYFILKRVEGGGGHH